MSSGRAIRGTADDARERAPAIVVGRGALEAMVRDRRERALRRTRPRRLERVGDARAWRRARSAGARRSYSTSRTSTFENRTVPSARPRPRAVAPIASSIASRTAARSASVTAASSSTSRSGPADGGGRGERAAAPGEAIETVGDRLSAVLRHVEPKLRVARIVGEPAVGREQADDLGDEERIAFGAADDRATSAFGGRISVASSM